MRTLHRKERASKIFRPLLLSAAIVAAFPGTIAAAPITVPGIFQFLAAPPIIRTRSPIFAAETKSTTTTRAAR